MIPKTPAELRRIIDAATPGDRLLTISILKDTFDPVFAAKLCDLWEAALGEYAERGGCYCGEMPQGHTPCPSCRLAKALARLKGESNEQE